MKRLKLKFRLLEKRGLRIAAKMLELERIGRISDEHKMDVSMAKLETLNKEIDANEKMLKQIRAIIEQMHILRC